MNQEFELIWCKLSISRLIERSCWKESESFSESNFDHHSTARENIVALAFLKKKDLLKKWRTCLEILMWWNAMNSICKNGKRGHGNESCNLISFLPGQYFPSSAHGQRLRFRESPSTFLLSLPFFINISRFASWAVFEAKTSVTTSSR